MREFIVNVFVQLFHSIVYVLVVSAGVIAFMTSENWLFMVLSIMFLFQGEKIIRNIFGLKSSANTIGDLAAAGATAWAITQGVRSLTAKGKGSKDEKETWDKVPESDSNSGTFVSGGRPVSMVPTGANALKDFDASAARNTVMENSMSKRKKNRGKFIVKGARFVGGGVGAILGATMGLAQGSAGAALSNAYAGKEVGKATAGGVLTIPRKIYNKVANTYQGKKMKRAVNKGKYDKELGIDKITDADIQDRVRKAMARASDKITRAGPKAGEAKFWKEIDKV